MLLYICLTAILLVPCLAYPGGAPPESCGNMLPNTEASPTGHGVGPDTGTSPYSLTLNGTKYGAGSKLTVKVDIDISIQKFTKFEGILLMGRKCSSTETTTRGTFAVPSTSYKNICPGADGKGGLTHTKELGPTDANTFTWTAPSDYEEGIQFYATIARRKIVYWVEIKSSCITYDSSLDSAAPRIMFGALFLLPILANFML